MTSNNGPICGQPLTGHACRMHGPEPYGVTEHCLRPANIRTANLSLGVLTAIAAERLYQTEKYGNERDDAHGFYEWQAILEGIGMGPPEDLRCYLKAAAVSIAALEAAERRGDPIPIRQWRHK